MPYPIRLAVYPLSAIFIAACTIRAFDPEMDTGLDPGLDPAATMDPAATNSAELPAPAVLRLNFSQIKQFDFSWTTAAGAEYYQLLERRAGGEDYAQIGDDLVGASISLTMPLHLRWGASYLVRACNSGGCTDSEPVAVVDSLASAVGYLKAANTGDRDHFGWSVALSADGDTLAVGAPWDDSAAAGAVHVFVRADNIWSQQAYIKASNPDHSDNFGTSVALSADGRTLAVGADEEDSNATGIDGDQADDSVEAAGAVYVFVRAHDTWSQQAYVKAADPGPQDGFGHSVALSADGDTLAVGAVLEGADDAGAVHVFVRVTNSWSQQAHVTASHAGHQIRFGHSVALSADGDTLAVGADGEDSKATGVDDDPTTSAFYDSGAAYVFVRAHDTWSQQAYVKASNPDKFDHFGDSVALSADGDTLAVGAPWERSAATGIDGDQADNSAVSAGAIYVFVRAAQTWSQQAYVKASNSGEMDHFGDSVALSADGDILAVGASYADGAAIGIGGDQADDSAEDAGAAYVFVRANDTWSQRAFVKAANTGAWDQFGSSIALAADGNVLAIGASWESSAATGINGDQADDSVEEAGAVYLY